MKKTISKNVKIAVGARSESVNSEETPKSLFRRDLMWIWRLTFESVFSGFASVWCVLGVENGLSSKSGSGPNLSVWCPSDVRCPMIIFLSATFWTWSMPLPGVSSLKIAQKQGSHPLWRREENRFLLSYLMIHNTFKESLPLPVGCGRSTTSLHVNQTWLWTVNHLRYM